MNHVRKLIATHLPGSPVQSREQRGVFLSCVQMSSGVDYAKHNLLLARINRNARLPLGQRISVRAAEVRKTLSGGEVRLRSADSVERLAADRIGETSR